MGLKGIRQGCPKCGPAGAKCGSLTNFGVHINIDGTFGGNFNSLTAKDFFRRSIFSNNTVWQMYDLDISQYQLSVMTY